MMNNCVQLSEKAEHLKRELTNTIRNGVNEDGGVTSSRAALRDLYRKILITNLEYALDKKVEQELWNIVFKNHITELQHQAKDKSNPNRSDIQSQLTVFLEASSGFYAMLLQDLCQIFKIDLPCRVRQSQLSLLKDADNIRRSSITQPERPSCQYMCQHCLVHLGDIARYRSQNGQAESYYRHAAQLVPSNGQPYNQLAILAAAGGDILSTAFYYCRSLAVKYPFPGSGTNLKRQLSKIIDGEDPRHVKISTSELVKFYLKFHACIYLKKQNDNLEVMVKRLLSYMRTHLQTGSLSKKQLVHMAFLNLFSLNHLLPSANLDDTGEKPEDNILEDAVSEEDEASWNSLISFTVQMLGVLVSCVPAYSDDNEDLEHPALPAAKLLLDWFCENDALLRNENISVTGSVWQRLARVLNALGNQDKANDMDGHPLPEDLEVRGFVGLRQSLLKLDFVGGYASVVAEKMQHPCRCYRLYQLGLVIARTSNGLLTTNEESNGTVFACPLPDEPLLEDDGDDLAVAENVEVNHRSETMERDNNRPPRMRKENTTSILVSSKKVSSESKKEKARLSKVAVSDSVAEQKLKSILEEDNSQRAEGARSSTASSLDSSCSSPNNADSAPHFSHKPHHVTFAPMPPRHSASPDHSTYYRRRSPSPEYSQQKSLPPPEMDYPPGHQYFPQDSKAHHMQGVMAAHGPIRPLQQTAVPMGGAYPRNFPMHASVLQPPSHVPFPASHMPRSIPNAGGPSRGMANPPPNPTELPKPIFTNHRIPFSHEHFPAQLDPATAGEGGNMYNARNVDGNAASLAHLAQLHQHQQLAQLANQAMANRTAQPRQPFSNNPGLAARFSNSNAMRFPPNMQSIKGLQQIDTRPGPPLNMEALWNQRNALHQSQRQQAAQLGFSDPKLSSQRGQESINMQMHGMPYQRNPPDMTGMPFLPFNQQVSRNLFPNVRAAQPHGSSPVDINNAPNTSSPTAAPVNLAPAGPVTSNTSPQAGSLPATRNLPMGNSGRFPEGFDQNLITQMIAAQQQKTSQKNFSKSPSQTSNIFSQDRTNNIFRTSENAAIPSARPNSILPGDIFAVSPKSGGMAQFGMSSIGQSPSSSSPSDPFPPYPLSQERQQIFEESLEMLDRTAAKPAGAVHQRPTVATSNSLIPESVNDKLGPTKPFMGLLTEENDESYKLFPSTDHSWTVGRNNRNDNSLGLSNLGSIGSERAMAQSQVPGRNLWSDYSMTPQVPNNQQQQQPQPSGISDAGNRFASAEYQSLWAGPMMPPGSSALEQLIRHQQQHAGHDKTPP